MLRRTVTRKNHTLTLRTTATALYSRSLNKMSDTTNSNSGSSMLSGHVHYVKGAAEEVIGNITGSEEWKRSGVQDKEAALAEMRAAHQLPDKGSMMGGKLESTLGRAVGCEGMIENGEQKQRMQQEK